MAMKLPWSWHAVARAGFLLMILACVLALLLRPRPEVPGPAIELVDSDGSLQTISLRELKAMDVLVRGGTYQNQYGNWRDAGVYSGVLLSHLLPSTEYTHVEVEAADGYSRLLERSRVVDLGYPMVLAFAMDGVEVPAWEDGFRIAVLPEDGAVSNEEYEAISAGSFWVKNVIRIRAVR